MKTIWKFPIKVGDIITIEMPLYSQVLTIQSQFDEPMMWALVDPKQIKETRYFEVFGTGHSVPDLDATKQRNYINTFQVHGGSLIFHLFELSRNFDAVIKSQNSGLIGVTEQ